MAWLAQAARHTPMGRSSQTAWRSWAFTECLRWWVTITGS